MCMCGAWSMTGIAMFSVIEKATGRWVGRLGPWYPEGWPDHEVGWGIAREHWGKGYASEGAAAAMDYAFDVLGWTEVIHCIDEQNAGFAGRRPAARAPRYLRRVTHARSRSTRCPSTRGARPASSGDQPKEMGTLPHFLAKGAGPGAGPAPFTGK